MVRTDQRRWLWDRQRQTLPPDPPAAHTLAPGQRGAAWWDGAVQRRCSSVQDTRDSSPQPPAQHTQERLLGLVWCTPTNYMNKLLDQKLVLSQVRFIPRLSFQTFVLIFDINHHFVKCESTKLSYNRNFWPERVSDFFNTIDIKLYLSSFTMLNKP